MLTKANRNLSFVALIVVVAIAAILHDSSDKSFFFVQAQEDTAAAEVLVSDDGGTTTITKDELAEIYLDAFLSFAVFPPLNDDPSIWIAGDGDIETPIATKPVTVVIQSLIVSVDSIDPGSSEFSVTVLTLMYYTQSECNNTNIHALACTKDLENGDGMRFVTNYETKDFKVTTSIFQPNVHASLFVNESDAIQPNLLIYETQCTFRMRC